MAEKLEKPSGELPQSAHPEETYKTSDPRPHYVELDGLRGIAILMTVTTHTAVHWLKMSSSPLYMPLLRVNLLDLIMYGYLAVPLFFLLSGYLLIWTEEKRKRRGTYSVLNYAKRRALRLVPAYYVAIAVVVLTTWSVGPSFGAVALHLTFLHGFVPSYPVGLDPAWWSLTPEIVFYAVLPLLVLKFRKFSQRAAILAVLLAVSLATRLLQAYDVFSILLPSLGDVYGPNRMHFFPTTYLYLFLVGVLLRMMVERRNRAGYEPGHRQLFAASTLTVLPVAVLAVFPYLIMKADQILHHPVTIIPEAMIILLFASVLLGSPVLKPIVRWRPLVLVGEISFSLFLLHTTVITVIVSYIRPTVRNWLPGQSEPMVWAAFFAYALVVFAAAGALAYLSYRYVESPFMRIKPK